MIPDLRTRKHWEAILLQRSRLLVTIVVAVLVLVASYLLGGTEEVPEPASLPSPSASATD